MPDPLSWLAEELEALHRQHLARGRRQVDPLPGGRCRIGQRTLWDFAGNDYLGLSQHPRVIEAAREALQSHGSGARASALVVGRGEWHARLEARLAEFEGQPAAILFPSGYAANVGTIAALLGPDDVVYCDRLNHASLVDGCRLSGARLRVFHRDKLERLERHLRSGRARRKLIVTDGVFSMDGLPAPLPELCDVAERTEAMLLVDEAHGTGVFGEGGRGASEHFGVEHRIPVRVGTLSKAVGALGGFVAGSEQLIAWLHNRAKSQMFSTALPPSVCAAAIAAIDIITTEPERRARLWELSGRLRNGLASVGIEPLAGSTGPIVPVVVGGDERTMQVAAGLEARGFVVGAIRPPTVPSRTSRLRITLSAAHSVEAVDELIEALVEVLMAGARV